MNRHQWGWGAAVGVATLITVEVAVRALGWVDFPVYAMDAEIGYYPQPNQAGSFLGKNRWVFNDRSMGIEKPWQPSDRTDVLLIGNSVILGGNNYDQPDKVTPQMQKHVTEQCTIWPVATGGWGTVNEYRFLDRHPDIVGGADFFIWEIMAHQMAGAQGWTRETAIPTHHPWWATGHVVRKLLHDNFPQWTLPTPRPQTVSHEELDHYYRQFEAMLTRLERNAGRKPAGIIFLYPDRQQLQGARQGLEWLADREKFVNIASAHGLVLIDITRYPQWTDAMYRDQVHPTAQGNAVLATILTQALRRTMPGC